MAPSGPLRRLMIAFLEWLGGHELAVLVAAVAIAAGVWGFIALASEIQDGDTQAFDRKVLLAMRRPGDLSPLGPPAVLESARDITALGSVVVLGLLTVITCGFLSMEGKSRMALFLFASIGGGAIASVLLKELFNRPRPEIVPHLAYASSSSFPSGHAMMSAVTWLTLGALLARSHPRKRFKAYFLLTGAFLALIIGVTRVYLGVHWPTDVLAGWTAGAVWALLSWFAARGLQSRRALEREEETN